MFLLAFQPHKWYNKSTTKPVITRCDLYKSEVVSALRKEGFDGKDVHALDVIPEKMGLVEHWGKIWMTTEKGVKHTIFPQAIDKRKRMCYTESMRSRKGAETMKLLGKMTVTEVAGEYIAVPLGEATEKFKGIVRLNGTGLDIWHALEEGKSEDEIARLLAEKYEGVELSKTKADTHAMIEKLTEAGILAVE